MTDKMPPLTPWSLGQLLSRVAHEWETNREIFGLQARRFFKLDPSIDLESSIAGSPVATPVGPAAGPHTQLAQNIVLSWLGGGRSFELKTVQVLDELEIERPCIDMENVGYNIEWSQELRLEESLHEYAKAWLMLEVLRNWEPLKEVLGDSGGHLFELSVGYDLAGVQSETMTRFIAGMCDATHVIDAMREEIPEPFAHLRDVPLSGRMVDAVTLSTFHGCPPDEIEGIIKHLMTAHNLDVTVKLNPTLLGMETVQKIVGSHLGYQDISLVPDAFAEDMKMDRALAMIDRLDVFAKKQGRVFGIKLTNTLVVENKRGILPAERMYLSGAPLHVLAISLLDRLQEALPGRLDLGPGGTSGRIPVAFSAGINKDNLAGTAALGLSPVTICSDLLKPGGYGRMAQGLRKMVRTIKDAGIHSLPEYIQLKHDQAVAAGHRDAVQALAFSLNSKDGGQPYTLAATDKKLRAVEHKLAMFDCVACTNCVTVCPNNAFLSVPSVGEDLEAREQYVVLAELCNDCGNCTTFCPEEGSPQWVKPRLYTKAAGSSIVLGAGEFQVGASPEKGLVVTGENNAARRLEELLAPLSGKMFE